MATLDAKIVQFSIRLSLTILVKVSNWQRSFRHGSDEVPVNLDVIELSNLLKVLKVFHPLILDATSEEVSGLFGQEEHVHEWIVLFKLKLWIVSQLK